MGLSLRQEANSIYLKDCVFILFVKLFKAVYCFCNYTRPTFHPKYIVHEVNDKPQVIKSYTYV